MKIDWQMLLTMLANQNKEKKTVRFCYTHLFTYIFKQKHYHPRIVRTIFLFPRLLRKLSGFHCIKRLFFNFTGAYDLNIAKGVWIGNKQGSGTFEEYTLCFWLKIENWVRVPGSNTAVQLVLTSMTVTGASLPKSLTYTLRGDEITDIRLEVGDFYKPKTR